ncbi:glycosyltransferase family 2 protein [Chryseobacterium joostei]|uniref:glycosyltransferase family 2 protein n=1 Tax=Chryseobacterium joostei TaxID=112234 RepID=UPI003D1285AE
MNNSIKISVIVPCYNQAIFLDDCINSLINQTYSNWECILVNDGSTDNTEDIALSWQKKDNRIKYIKKINGGLSSARNAGIQNITGDFVQFLDCDDYLYNEKFEKSVKEINNQTNAIVITDFQRFDSATQTVLPPHCILKTEYFSQKEILLKWDNTFSIPIHCAIFSRDIVEKYKFNEELKAKEDWFFWLQAYENTPETHFVPEYLLAYRMNSAGMTHNLFFMQENRIKALDKLEQVISDKDLLIEFFKQDLLSTMKENLQLMERIKLLGYKRTMKYKINKVLKAIGIKRD